MAVGPRGFLGSQTAAVFTTAGAQHQSVNGIVMCFGWRNKMRMGARGVGIVACAARDEHATAALANGPREGRSASRSLDSSHTEQSTWIGYMALRRVCFVVEGVGFLFWPQHLALLGACES